MGEERQMSRAFVKESDQEEGGALPERPVSTHPNFVTPAGLHQIEAQVRALEAEREVARAADDKPTLARVARDLRYWTSRRASARLIEPGTTAPQAVRFGTRVTLEGEDGGTRTFRLVGEDEADPAQGLLSYVSPVATVLMGKAEGDIVSLPGHKAEIIKIEV
jgi:transcription elongation GreA/GreB family factor